MRRMFGAKVGYDQLHFKGQRRKYANCPQTANQGTYEDARQALRVCVPTCTQYLTEEVKRWNDLRESMPDIPIN